MTTTSPNMATSAWFTPLLRSEWRKIASTKLPAVLIVIAVLYSCLQVVTLVILAGGLLDGFADLPVQDSMLMDPDYIGAVLGEVGTASTFVLLLGIVGMTGEYRHMTITSTYLATPRRSRVLLTKMLVYALLGAAVAVLTTIVVTAVTSVALLPFEHAPITAGAIGSVLVGSVIGLALFAVLGVSLGALIPNQVAAIVTALVWMLLIEALVTLAFPKIGPWLPGGALNSAMDVGLQSDLSGGFSPAASLPVWGGILVLLAYAAVFGAIASRTTLARDIT